MGHLEIVTENFSEIHDILERYAGLLFCTVQCPSRLYLPLLNSKINNKLVFPLCGKCANEQLQMLCPHSQDERRLMGVFMHVELNKAVQLGYRLTHVYEIWS